MCVCEPRAQNCTPKSCAVLRLLNLFLQLMKRKISEEPVSPASLLPVAPFFGLISFCSCQTQGGETSAPHSRGRDPPPPPSPPPPPLLSQYTLTVLLMVLPWR